MTVFEYEGSKYITINGKSFCLLQGYSTERGSLIFAQVVGSYPLYTEDLPDKKWKLAKTKWKDRVIYVVYNQEYHCYQSDRAKGKLLFPAPTSKGSFFLLLKHVNEKHSFKIPEQKLERIPERLCRGTIDRLADQGNMGSNAYILNHEEGTEEILESIIKPEKEERDDRRPALQG